MHKLLYVAIYLSAELKHLHPEHTCKCSSVVSCAVGEEHGQETGMQR